MLDSIKMEGTCLGVWEHLCKGMFDDRWDVFEFISKIVDVKWIMKRQMCFRLRLIRDQL